MCMDSQEMNAEAYFSAKLAFTTGPIEVNHMITEDHDHKVTIVDVRAAEDYAKGHIPGAINVPQDQWDSTDLPSDATSIFYCYAQQCHLAAKAALTYARKGQAVVELEGGWSAWEAFGLEVEK